MRSVFLASAILLVCWLSGCTAGAPARSGPAPQTASVPGVARGLVLPPDSLAMDGEGGWEASRRDFDLGVRSGPPVVWRDWIEIENRDRRQTINGHVREYSRTTVRTLRRGFIDSR